jgi:hypothetical protein
VVKIIRPTSVIFGLVLGELGKLFLIGL